MNNKSNKPKILFICKYREIDDESCYSFTLSSGLLNSATFVKDMLVAEDIQAKLVQVLDNNDIDREVTAYRPTHVIIEALWVVPEKFPILIKLHPEVEWIIRLHSETPFLANEGMASDWLFKYNQLYPKVRIAANSERIIQEYEHLLNRSIYYLPNYYPVNMDNMSIHHKTISNNYLSIGCFGAIRPLKNQLIQAHSAIRFADSLGMTLRFYMNGSRKECGGSPVQRNIIKLFENVEHELLELPWMPHDRFKQYLKDNIDIGMQVTLSETYNIIAADMVDLNIPVVASPEVRWMNRFFKANPLDSVDIINKLSRAWFTRNTGFCRLNKIGLRLNSIKAKKVWKRAFRFQGGE